MSGHASRHQGTTGELAAKAFLSEHLSLATPELDEGFDVFGSLRIENLTQVLFCFQVKTGLTIKIEGRKLLSWARITESQPIFILHVESPNTPEQKIRFLSLYRWYFSNECWFEKASRQKSVTLRLSRFSVVDADKGNFRKALCEEALRVLREPNALLRIGLNINVPFYPTDLFRYFGNLPSLEVLASALQAAKVNDRLSSESDLWSFLNKVGNAARVPAEVSPEISEWIKQLNAPVDGVHKMQERQNFKMFVRSMEGFASQKHFDLPGFSHRQISTWRILVQLFPESVRMLAAAAKHSDRWSKDKQAGMSLLLSTLSASSDQNIANKAVDALHGLIGGRVSSRCSESDYILNRQFQYALAEANANSGAVKKFIDFLHRHPVEWDLKLHRVYYRTETDEIYERSARQKLAHPRPRDLRTKQISVFYLERIKRA